LVESEEKAPSANRQRGPKAHSLTIYFRNAFNSRAAVSISAPVKVSNALPRTPVAWWGRIYISFSILLEVVYRYRMGS
jgi:hypothetical protein